MKHNIKFNANWAIRRKYSRYPICSGFGDVCFEWELFDDREYFIEDSTLPVCSILNYEEKYTIKTSAWDMLKIKHKLNEAGKLFLYVTPENRDVTIKDIFTEISYTPTEDLDRFFNVSYKRNQ